MLIIQQKGTNLISEVMQDERRWDYLLQGRRWKKREWMKWARNNPEWKQAWEKPIDWLPGEKQWFDGEDSWQERIRRISVKAMAEYEAVSEEVKGQRLRAREEEKRMKEAKREVKRLRKLREKEEEDDRWFAHCVNN
jgi:hypothetical protein